MGPVSMSDSCKVNEKALLPQLFKSGLFFKVLCKRNVFNLIRVNEKHQRETYSGCDQGTDVVEIIGGDLKKTIMIGDSEVDAMSAYNAKVPFVLMKDGYTEKSENERSETDE